ncbi:MAG TPA: hypothetical protein DCQ77_08295, partial [Betaproteobacteria bacterium]|nr:hypothetical protein [Betaproteobacteria bacterium]
CCEWHNRTSRALGCIPKRPQRMSKLFINEPFGEQRMICFGFLAGRMVAVGYVQRGETRHIFSMRKANEREQNRFAQ